MAVMIMMAVSCVVVVMAVTLTGVERKRVEEGLALARRKSALAERCLGVVRLPNRPVARLQPRELPEGQNGQQRADQEELQVWGYQLRMAKNQKSSLKKVNKGEIDSICIVCSII
jgi:hypothetical protein